MCGGFVRKLYFGGGEVTGQRISLRACNYTRHKTCEPSSTGEFGYKALEQKSWKASAVIRLAEH
jgi:hypothetical protein